MASYRLRQWSVIRRLSRTHGGEREYLRGRVYGDSRWPDGTFITTSAIAWRDGRGAVTASGHRYVLEDAQSSSCEAAPR